MVCCLSFASAAIDMATAPPLPANCSLLCFRGSDLDDDNGYWALAKTQLLNDPRELLKKLLNYDKDAIDYGVITAIQVWLGAAALVP